MPYVVETKGLENLKKARASLYINDFCAAFVYLFVTLFYYFFQFLSSRGAVFVPIAQTVILGIQNNPCGFSLSPNNSVRLCISTVIRILRLLNISCDLLFSAMIVRSGIRLLSISQAKKPFDEFFSSRRHLAFDQAVEIIHFGALA